MGLFWARGRRATVEVLVAIFLGEATVGLFLMGYHALRHAGVYGGDLVGCARTMLHASLWNLCGAGCVVALSLHFVIHPLLHQLFHRNVLISSFGIACELIFYDMF